MQCVNVIIWPGSEGISYTQHVPSQSNRITNVVRDWNDAQQCTNTICLHVRRAGKIQHFERMDMTLLNYTWRRNHMNCARYYCGMNKWCIIDTGSVMLCIPCSQISMDLWRRSGDLRDIVSPIQCSINALCKYTPLASPGINANYHLCHLQEMRQRRFFFPCCLNQLTSFELDKLKFGMCLFFSQKPCLNRFGEGSICISRHA